MELIDKTQSLCPICLKAVDADVVREAETLFLLKACPTHGSFKTKHPWSNIRDYRAIKILIPNSAAPHFSDGFALNLTSRCNLKCPFCFARANEYKLEEPDLNKIINMINDFKGTYVYLSGGEPTLREDIFDIIALIKKMGYKTGMFTNGKLLTELKFVKRLKRAGLDLVILQFDTLSDEQYRVLRGEPLLSVKMAAIDNLKLCHMPVYLFAMLVKGININQIKHLTDYAVQNSDVVKLINLNPVWEIGRTGAHEEMGASEILTEVEKQTDFNFEDFISSTEFSYNLSEILKKLTKKGGRKHPQCEIGCYVIITKTFAIPISRILNLNRLNRSLRKINEFLNTNPTFSDRFRVLFLIPYVSLLKDFLKNSLLRKRSLELIAAFLRKGDLTSLNAVNIIIGIFHTANNIDLNMANTCKLFSDYKAGSFSSCLRQICFLKSFATNKAAVS